MDRGSRWVMLGAWLCCEVRKSQKFWRLVLRLSVWIQWTETLILTPYCWNLDLIYSIITSHMVKCFYTVWSFTRYGSFNYFISAHTVWCRIYILHKIIIARPWSRVMFLWYSDTRLHSYCIWPHHFKKIYIFQLSFATFSVNSVWSFGISTKVWTCSCVCLAGPWCWCSLLAENPASPCRPQTRITPSTGSPVMRMTTTAWRD